MNTKRILIVAIMLIVLIFAMVGCNTKKIDYVNEYKQVIYRSELGKFQPTGNSIVIHEDYTFDETYSLNKGNKTFKGNYVQDEELDLLYMEFNDSSDDSFKRTYRSELLAQNYTRSEIDNYLLPSIKKKGEFYKYKDYFFKVNAINASREGTIDTVNQLDGIYNTDAILGKKDSKIKLHLGSIFLKEIDEFGEEKYEKKIGTYKVMGDMIEIAPIVALDGGNAKVNPPMRYLLAEIKLPRAYQDDMDENNKYNGNDVITVYNNVKVKVIVGSFYTTKDTK